MIQRLVVRSAAEADIVQAALWYEQRAPGLGADFLRAVDVGPRRLRSTPRPLRPPPLTATLRYRLSGK
jgi:hypothetical protein